MKNFENFTNLYELSKTLRFELKPIWETEKLLEENYIIELDKKRKESYEKVKPYFDLLHLDFIKHSLKNPNMNFKPYFELYKDWNKDKKNKNKNKETEEKNKNKNKETEEKNKETEEKSLMKQIEEKFNQEAKKYLENYTNIKFKKSDKDFLYEIEVFEILKDKFWNNPETQVTDPETWEITTIFDNWNNWLGYFTKFFNTRKNFYKSDGTSTAIATRIINDNLKIFIENLIIFEKIKEKLNFTNIEKDFWINLEDIFELDYYNKCFLQNWIDFYNLIIWWKTLGEDKILLNWKELKSGTKIKWLNEYINLYRQKSKEKLPFFKKLQKQILSDKKNNFIEQIEDNKEFEKILRDFFDNSNNKSDYLKDIFGKLSEFNDQQYKEIYLNKIAWNTLSHKFAWNVLLFEKIVFEELLEEKLVEKKHFDKKENKYKFPNFIPIFYIKNALEKYKEEWLFWKERYYTSDNEFENGFLERENKNLWKQFCDILNFEFQNIFSREIVTDLWEKTIVWYDISKEKLWNILTKEKFELTDTTRGLIKDFADYARVIYNFGKYFALEKSRSWDNNHNLNSDFYEWENWYIEKFYSDAYEEIIKPYNLMRNYIAKKPWSDAKKWKINFEKSSLLSGWEKNIESNWAYIFRKNDKYYLWIINWTKPKPEEIEKIYRLGEEKIERFVYDFQKPDNKNIPRTFIRSKWESFAPAVEKYNLPVQNILEIYDNWYFKTENKNNQNYKSSLTKLIDYFKLWLSKHDSYKHYNFIWKDSSDYNNIAEFYRDTEKSCYKPDWETLNYYELLNLVNNWKLYFFQIYNKDFELDKTLQEKDYNFKWKWQKNIHTLYFESLFKDENIKNIKWVIMKLSWWWEVFFRPKAIEEKEVSRNFSRKIIENKRYTECKFMLHFPIQLNFKEDIWMSFNEKINQFLANNKDINIIWIDRWEKHLAYFSVINQKSEILESWTLNQIENFDTFWNLIMRPEKKIVEKKDNEWNMIEYILQETWKKVPYIDYALLLEIKEKNRKLQRQSWKEVEQIKDLKKWYISALVKKLTDLIIKYNAIVIFEDLNMRFKQIRGWIEKSVYQQLEKALIDKLNFLVNKNEMNPEKAGNLLKAYQLTAPVEAFKDMWKQTWIIFYTQASYTSKIDPLTGWRPNLYLKKTNAEKNKENILKFDNIIFNAEKNRFEFTYNLKNFIKSEEVEFPKKTNWTVCSCVERFKWNKFLNNNKWGYDIYENLTDWNLKNRKLKEDEIVNFRDLFEKYNIWIDKNILEQVKNLETVWNEKFFSRFIDLFVLMCQIRNTDKSKFWNENDFILSPVEPFFDTRIFGKFGKHLPKNGDDNGAYNIARKGIIILKRISNWSIQNKEKYPDLFVSNIEWDNFIAI